MTIYLMRHGITDLNKNGYIQGGLTDAKLCKEGLDQANACIDFINNLNIKHVYSGQLDRQVETAKIVTSQCKGIDYHILSNFNEMSFGEFEATHVDIAFPLIYERTGFKMIDFHSHDQLLIGEKIKEADTSGLAETTEQVTKRFFEGIKQIESTCIDGNVLVVSSGMSISCFVRHYCKFINKYSMCNCSISKLTKTDEDMYLGECIFEGAGK